MIKGYVLVSWQLLIFVFITTSLLIVQVQCGDAEVERKINEKIDQFISWVEKHPNKKSQVHDFPLDFHLPGIGLWI